jgi:recombination protein RecA
MMGTAMRKLAGPVKKNNVLLLFTNQYRKNPNEQVMRGSTKVASEDPSGGLALQFAASVSVKLRTMGKSSGGQVMRGKEQVGQRIHADIMKNKVGKPFGTAEFDIVWGAGIDRVSDVLDTATRLDIIHRAGASYSFGDRKLGVGRDNVRAMLAEDAILVEEIYQHTIAEVRGGKVIAPAPEPMPDEDEGEEE